MTAKGRSGILAKLASSGGGCEAERHVSLLTVDVRRPPFTVDCRISSSIGSHVSMPSNVTLSWAQRGCVPRFGAHMLSNSERGENNLVHSQAWALQNAVVCVPAKEPLPSSARKTLSEDLNFASTTID
jgi:hypothetical protein